MRGLKAGRAGGVLGAGQDMLAEVITPGALDFKLQFTIIPANCHRGTYKCPAHFQYYYFHN